MAPLSLDNRCGGCSRLSHKECTRKMCFTCCSGSSLDGCEVHALMRAKKQEEDRMLAAAVQDVANKSGSGRRDNSTRFRHHEERFDSYNQTVVIWCLRDFLRTGKHSDDTITAELKALRQRALNRRRGLHKSASSGTTSSSNSTSNSSSGKKSVAKSAKKSVTPGCKATA